MGFKKNWKKTIIAALTATFLAGAMTVQATGGAINTAQSSSIAIAYKDRNGAGLPDMRVRVFKVADVTGSTVDGAVNGYDVTYTLTKEFYQFDETNPDALVRVTDFSEAKLNDALIVRPGETDAAKRARWQKIADTLRPYALSELSPTAFRYTDDNGKVELTGLTPGLYLLIADGVVVKEDDADYRYSYLPTFVMLPWYENGLWDYNRSFTFEEGSVLRPKYTYEKVEYDYRVYKRWYNDNSSVRPSEVRVDIYRDGELYRTVYLNESNNWTYTWTGGSQSFYVIERTTGSNYSVTITTQKDSSFTLDNTYNPPSDNPPPPPEEVPPPPGEVLGTRRLPDLPPATTVDEPAVLGTRRLPRTGQLNWPIPVLLVVGMLLFSAGYYRHKKHG